MRRITFSRNYTLSLSRTCRCYCKYCAFATHQAHLHTPEEVERELEQAVRRNAKELLVLTGELPEVNPIVAERRHGATARGHRLAGVDPRVGRGGGDGDRARGLADQAPRGQDRGDRDRR